MDFDENNDWAADNDGTSDPVELEARDKLIDFFDARTGKVFFSRRVELHYEDDYFHWITNRAIRSLVREGYLISEEHGLPFGGRVKLIWRRTFRYYKKEAKSVVELVGQYSEPVISDALGQQGEIMVLKALALGGFGILAEHTNNHRGKAWDETAHNLDLIVEKDGIGYGVEVKNTLQYIDLNELRLKVRLCAHLGLRPLFAVRMMPKTWIYKLQKGLGYALVLKWQFYPWGHSGLARRVETELGLPVRCNRSIEEGAVARLNAWHQRHVNFNLDSHGY